MTLEGDTLEVAENAADNLPQALEGGTLRLMPTPSPTIHLKSLHDVRIEMAKVYREMKRGKVPAQDGTRLVYVLSQIGRVIEGQIVGDRVEAVERVLRMRGNS